ncbi:MAG: DUF72 domain-containing protein [Chloroflexi bacterium]|nr:DUF72 domain-containing protein [Chloroflexota bacterium]
MSGVGVAIRRYRLGCPVWGHAAWAGSLFTRDAGTEDFLRQYASVFNAVEGNTTFYGSPRPATVDRWAADTPPGFRFSFKLPREITHEQRLVGTEPAIRAFLDLMAPMVPRLGPFMLQLPPAFGPDALAALERCLQDLPSDFDYAVELRHPAFFAGGPAERQLDEILAARAVDRVIFDTRGLFQSDASDPVVREAQHRKPRLPVRLTVTGRRPVVRFVAHAEPEANRWLLKGWADQLATWILDGLEPQVFVHAPDELHAPWLARELHRLLGHRVDVGELPAWPGELEPPEPEQLALFG